MQDLKERTVCGALARMFSQAANFMLRFGSLVVLSRLLEPKDFGLVGMVTAFTGVLNPFQILLAGSSSWIESSSPVKEKSLVPA